MQRGIRKNFRHRKKALHEDARKHFVRRKEKNADKCKKWEYT